MTGPWTLTFTAPEAASAISRIYAICLLGLDRSFLGRPRSFRVYSGSWPTLPGMACVHSGQAPDASFDTMDMQQFWKLIEDARRQVPDPADGEEVAARAAALLSAYPREEIVAAEQVLGELMAWSYRTPLWAAAYVINGGCSNDGFDYFRGWLILQGREVFEHVVADPDALADLPVIRARALGAACLECEDTLYIASRAHRAATGEDLPPDPFPIRYRELDLDPVWDFDFDDGTEMKRRLPRLAALFLD